jgi:signal transduction histidine kinase
VAGIDRQLQSTDAPACCDCRDADAERRLPDELLSIAAHELRTPLTVLSLEVELLRRQAERSTDLEQFEVIEVVAMMEYQTDKLVRMLNQLLDVSRVDAGKLMLNPRPVDLTTLVQNVAHTTQLWQDRHPIVVMTPESLPTVADQERLERVLTNLLDNAIKFSPDGAPIEVRLTRRPHGTVELAVRDHGPGIASDQRERIFGRFYQVQAGGSQTGLGLGLYISRQIVELHGGAIRVDCHPGGGTVVVVRLPIVTQVKTAMTAERGNGQTLENV